MFNRMQCCRDGALVVGLGSSYWSLGLPFSILFTIRHIAESSKLRRRIYLRCYIPQLQSVIREFGAERFCVLCFESMQRFLSAVLTRTRVWMYSCKVTRRVLDPLFVCDSRFSVCVFDLL